MWVDTVVLEDSLLRRFLNLLKELLWTIDLDPRLTQAGLLRPDVLDLHIPLLIRIIRLVEEISDVLAVYLQG